MKVVFFLDNKDEGRLCCCLGAKLVWFIVVLLDCE